MRFLYGNTSFIIFILTQRIGGLISKLEKKTDGYDCSVVHDEIQTSKGRLLTD